MEHESRSASHRRVKRIEAAGRRLIDLPASRLEAAPLSDELRAAVLAAKTMSRTALRRQSLFIGRLIRQLDDEGEAIVGFVEEGEGQSREQARDHAQLEGWRDRLLAEGETAVTDLLALHPQADRQRLRQLLRTAAKESGEGKPPAAARKLFRYLRELFATVEPPETE